MFDVFNYINDELQDGTKSISGIFYSLNLQ